MADQNWPGAIGEFAIGAIEDESSVAGSEPAVAILSLVAVSPEAGGILASQPEVAILELIAISPDVIAGITPSEPEVAILELVAISPVFSLPFISAVLGQFGIEVSYKADEFETEETYIADEIGAGANN